MALFLRILNDNWIIHNRKGF